MPTSPHRLSALDARAAATVRRPNSAARGRGCGRHRRLGCDPERRRTSCGTYEPPRTRAWLAGSVRGSRRSTRMAPAHRVAARPVRARSVSAASGREVDPLMNRRSTRPPPRSTIFRRSAGGRPRLSSWSRACYHRLRYGSALPSGFRGRRGAHAPVCAPPHSDRETKRPIRVDGANGAWPRWCAVSTIEVRWSRHGRFRVKPPPALVRGDRADRTSSRTAREGVVVLHSPHASTDYLDGSVRVVALIGEPDLSMRETVLAELELGQTVGRPDLPAGRLPVRDRRARRSGVDPSTGD
jgi:hypothetical protein